VRIPAVAAASVRCPQCQLVNFADTAGCRRCGAALDATAAATADAAATSGSGIAKRLLWLAAVTAAVMFGWSRSLVLTSEPIDDAQRALVMHAIARIEDAGFSREVVMLRHFANYRATDNWWNRHLGHGDAYAATNFPLGVVTLYRPFFEYAADDTERAAVLLHEAQHLLGAGEADALETVWREKGRLGWTATKYGQTRVWRNTREWTQAALPQLFACGGAGSASANCAR
jgi:hypothetical protein